MLSFFLSVLTHLCFLITGPYPQPALVGWGVSEWSGRVAEEGRKWEEGRNARLERGDGHIAAEGCSLPPPRSPAILFCSTLSFVSGARATYIPSQLGLQASHNQSRMSMPKRSVPGPSWLP